MNADFVRIAHRKAVWAELQRILLDRFVEQDGPPKEQIICEEVPFAQKDVTNEAVLEVLELIQQHEVDEQLEMKQFEFRRRRPKNEQHGNQQASAPSPVQAEGAPAAAPVPEPAAAPADGSAGGASKPAG